MTEMRTVSPLLLLLSIATLLGACSSSAERRHFNFPVTSRHHVEPSAGKPRLYGLTTEFGGQVPVFVGRSEKGQVLHLTSFSSAIWHVYLFPGSRVRRIYLSGFDPQGIVVHRSRSFLRRKTPTVVDLGTNLRYHATLSFGPPINLQHKKAQDYRMELRSVTGLDLTDFEGHRFLRSNDAFYLAKGKPSRRKIRTHFPQALTKRPGSQVSDWLSMQRDIKSLIDRAAIPAKLPLFRGLPNLRPEHLSYWQVMPDGTPSQVQPTDLECARYQLGTRGDDMLWCDERDGYRGRTRWLVAGPGRDIIHDQRGLSQVISGGKGDDIINADFGNDILHFGRNWGQDVVDLRCWAKTASYWGAGKDKLGYDDYRYVIFGRGIKPADLRWVNGMEIEHRPTGSRIRFTGEPCARFLAVETGSIPRPPLDH